MAARPHRQRKLTMVGSDLKRSRHLCKYSLNAANCICYLSGSSRAYAAWPSADAELSGIDEVVSSTMILIFYVLPKNN